MKASSGMLSLCVKLLIISILAGSWQAARAEFYQLTVTQPKAQYFYCTKPSKSHHHYRHVHSAHYRHHYARNGLYVYYPVGCPCNDFYTDGYCACRPKASTELTQGGEYVTFSTKPAHEPRRWPIGRESRYSPDQRTADDVGADMEIN